MFWKPPFKRRNETASYHPWDSCIFCHNVLHSNLEYHGIIYKELLSEELKIPIFQIDTGDSKGLNCSPECQLQSAFPRTKNRVWIQFGPMEEFRKFSGLLCMLSKLKGTKSLFYLGSENYHHAFHLGFLKNLPKFVQVQFTSLEGFLSWKCVFFLTKLFLGRVWSSGSGKAKLEA